MASVADVLGDTGAILLDGAALTRRVEELLVSCERTAAATAEPTPYGHDVIRVCADLARPVVVVSNNSRQAVEEHLHRHGLAALVRTVVGRAFARPELMKPHPYPVERALAALGETASRCVLVGDSETDVEVARRAGTRCVAYATTPSHVDGLTRAAPDAVVESMHDVVAALA